MGCDIYLYVEHYNKESKRWDNLSLYKKYSEGEFSPVDIYDGRDYELFSLLAGVRSIIDPFVLPRGVPDDMSCEVSKAYGDGQYFYTSTWYDWCELQAYERMMVNSCKEITNVEYDDDDDAISLCERLNGFMNDIEKVLNAYDIYYPKPGDIRVVMWFDS